jgi:hypothetical protein
MNHELAKTLTTALVQFIDRESSEGTMCCSNIECGALEEAFKSDNLDDVEAFIQKKLSRLTEFETHLKWLIENGGSGIEHVKVEANELLALAKKELFEKWNENMKDEYARGKKDGLTIGYNKAMKEYNESVAYHFPIMPTPPSGLGCDGTHCTNPQMDCINCPRKTTGGSFSTSSASGTSAATLHGNTSVTDGKPHNPSFID